VVVGRYFVVLKGARSGVLYVIAEVVREPTDDGLDRELSLAGNLAGSHAIIVTEAELRALPSGRVALEHWSSGNDTSFTLDTLAHDLDMVQLHGAMDPTKAMTVEEAHLFVEDNRRRSREMLKETGVVREKSEEVREALRETLEKVQAQRSKTAALLDEIGKQMRKPDAPTKRRHLRSVS
jgi:hypothetical protein